MSFYADSPAELLYAMNNVGNACTNTFASTGSITSNLASGGPMMGGGVTAGAASTVAPCEIPHNYFSKIGKAILIDGQGVYSLGSVIPTLRIALYLSTALGNPGTGGSVILAQTGAFNATDTTTGRTNMGFNFRVWVTCTGVGNNGTLQSWGWLNWGMLNSANLTTTVVAPQISYYMGAGTTTPLTFNTNQTTPVYLEPYAAWSTSSTGPTITLTQMFVWGLN